MQTGIWAFVVFAAVLAITPGSDTAMTVRATLGGGRAAGLRTVAGIAAGCLAHAAASALGLSWILAQSAGAYDAIRTAGALYLIWLGLQSLRTAWRDPQPQTAATTGSAHPFREGLFTNLLNPKVSLFYLTVLPQFVSPGRDPLGQSLLLASIHIVIGVVWLSFLVSCLGRLRGTLSRAPVRRSMEAATGVLLAGLGARLVLEKS